MLVVMRTSRPCATWGRSVSRASSNAQSVERSDTVKSICCGSMCWPVDHVALDDVAVDRRGQFEVGLGEVVHRRRAVPVRPARLREQCIDGGLVEAEGVQIRLGDGEFARGVLELRPPAEMLLLVDGLLLQEDFGPFELAARELQLGARLEETRLRLRQRRRVNRVTSTWSLPNLVAHLGPDRHDLAVEQRGDLSGVLRVEREHAGDA